jgi:hypothetical protein
VERTRISRQKSVRERHLLKRGVVLIEDFEKPAVNLLHACTSDFDGGAGEKSMPDRVCPAERGPQERLSIGFAPGLRGELRSSNIGHLRDKIQATDKLSLARQSNRGGVAENGARIEINAHPLCREAPRAHERFHEKGGIWLTLEREEARVLDSAVDNTEECSHHLVEL